jgi:hypothetical protein
LCAPPFVHRPAKSWLIGHRLWAQKQCLGTTSADGALDTFVLPVLLGLLSRCSNGTPANTRRACFSRVGSHLPGSSSGKLPSILLPHVCGVDFLRCPVRRFAATDLRHLYRYASSQLQAHQRIPFDFGSNAQETASPSTSKSSCMCQMPQRAPLLRAPARAQHLNGLRFCQITQPRQHITFKFKLRNPPPPFRSFRRPLPS